MATIRNACVARGQITASANLLVYTVPAGHVLLLKAMHFTAIVAGTQGLTVQINAAGGGAPTNLVFLNVSTPSYYTWQSWTALNPGDTITLYNTGIAMSYWIAGALLPEQIIAGATAQLTEQLAQSPSPTSPPGGPPPFVTGPTTLPVLLPPRT